MSLKENLKHIKANTCKAHKKFKCYECMRADRDSWKEAHEGAVYVRQADLEAVTKAAEAKVSALTKERDEARERADRLQIEANKTFNLECDVAALQERVKDCMAENRRLNIESDRNFDTTKILTAKVAALTKERDCGSAHHTHFLSPGECYKCELRNLATDLKIAVQEKMAIAAKVAEMEAVVEAAKKSARWIPHTGYGPGDAHIDCRRCEMDSALSRLTAPEPGYPPQGFAVTLADLEPAPEGKPCENCEGTGKVTDEAPDWGFPCPNGCPPSPGKP